MRTVSALLFFLPLAVQGGPCRPSGRPPHDTFCEINVDIIAALHQEAAATAFCESLLSISTLISTETATFTPSSVYDTVPLTVTGPAVTSALTSTETLSTDVTVSSTFTETDTTTITLTTTTVTLTCLDSAFAAVTPASSSAASSSAASISGSPVQKRQAPRPAGLPADWPDAYLSSACSCLSIPTPSATATVTDSLAPDTVTVTSTQTETPTSTVTSSADVTSTDWITETVSSTTTETSTVYATATTIVSNGLSYRRYTSDFDANVAGSGFTSTYFKSAPLIASGSISSLSFATPDWPSSDTTLTLSDGSSFDAEQAALLIQGFFVAPQTGFYRFYSSSDYIDNWGYLWVGDVAYSSWDDSNTAFQVSRTGDGLFDTGDLLANLNEGDAIPMTWLWANGGGAGQSYFLVTLPDGQDVYTTGLFVQACSADIFT